MSALRTYAANKDVIQCDCAHSYARTSHRTTKASRPRNRRCDFIMENRYNTAEEYAAMVRAIRSAVDRLHQFEDEITFLYSSAVDNGPVDLNGKPISARRIKVKEEMGLLPERN